MFSRPPHGVIAAVHKIASFLETSSEEGATLSQKTLMLTSLHDMLDRQFQAYSRNDTKCNALITIDVAMVSGMLVFAKQYGPISGMALALLGASFILFVASFVTCLSHTLPRSEAGIGNSRDNPRGFSFIKRYSREDYWDRIRVLTVDDLLRTASYQISGMTRNNLRGQRLVLIGVLLTISGVCVFAGTIIVSVL